MAEQPMLLREGMALDFKFKISVTSIGVHAVKGWSPEMVGVVWKRNQRMQRTGLLPLKLHNGKGVTQFNADTGGDMEMINKVDVGSRGQIEEKFHRFSIEETRSKKGRKVLGTVTLDLSKFVSTEKTKFNGVEQEYDVTVQSTKITTGTIIMKISSVYVREASTDADLMSIMSEMPSMQSGGSMLGSSDDMFGARAEALNHATELEVEIEKLKIQLREKDDALRHKNLELKGLQKKLETREKDSIKGSRTQSNPVTFDRVSFDSFPAKEENNKAVPPEGRKKLEKQLSVSSIEVVALKTALSEAKADLAAHDSLVKKVPLLHKDVDDLQEALAAETERRKEETNMMIKQLGVEREKWDEQRSALEAKLEAKSEAKSEAKDNVKMTNGRDNSNPFAEDTSELQSMNQKIQLLERQITDALLKEQLMQKETADLNTALEKSKVTITSLKAEKVELAESVAEHQTKHGALAVELQNYQFLIKEQGVMTRDQAALRKENEELTVDLVETKMSTATLMWEREKDGQIMMRMRKRNEKLAERIVNLEVLLAV